MRCSITASPGISEKLLKSMRCKVLASRDNMDQVKEEGEDLPWLDLVKRCYSRGVDLTGHHQGHSIVDGLANYVIMAAAVTEVEIDVLTGMHQIRRCDFIEDTGFSTYCNIE